LKHSEEALIDDSGRRYSDKEVARLLKKATELQEESGSDSDGGLSMPVLSEIAREIGVDQVFLERAAATLDEREVASPTLWGGPSHYSASLTSTRQLSREELLEVVDVVRRTTQHQGSVQEVLGSLEWKTSGEVSEIVVTATATKEGAQVRVIADRSAASALTWGFTVAGGLVAGGITGAILEPSSVLAGIGIMAAGGTAGLALGRALCARSTRSFRRRFSRLRNELSGHLLEVDNRS
jgi:hypothetical protein